MKPKIPRSPVNRLLLDEASEWFVDFRVDDVSDQSRVQFAEWLRRSPEHIRAYMEIATTYVDLSLVKPLETLDVDSLIAYACSSENVVLLDATTTKHSPSGAHAQANPPQPPGTRGEPHSTSWRQRLAIAACVIATTIGGALWWQSARGTVYATDVGERRTFVLADGSTVDLNARSRIRVDFLTDERRVVLEDGQALFQVAKDKGRPFVVHGGEATIRAVGTQFDVYKRSRGTTVTVLEGKVTVYSMHNTDVAAQTGAALPPANSQSLYQGSRSNPPAGSAFADSTGFHATYLTAGEQVTVTHAGTAVPERVDTETVTAWRQSRLIFDASPLSDVADKFNRYNRRQIVIDGKELWNFQISGVYSSGDSTSLIRFLREQPGIKITEDRNVIRISHDSSR
jgi:transmembrane sensor